MKAETFFYKLITEETYLKSECGRYAYRSVPGKPDGWEIWRKTLDGGGEQPYNWNGDRSPGCWLEAVIAKSVISKVEYDNFPAEARTTGG